MATNKRATDRVLGAPGAAPVAREYSFLRNDFPAIRRATLTFILCVAVGMALVISTQYLLDQQVAIFNRAQALQISSNEKFRQAVNERRQILDYQNRYQQLTTQRFVGPELRLDWIEAIQATQKTAHLQPLDYEISPQQPFVVDPVVDMAALTLRGSKMLVKMNFVHEMELFRLLDGLQAKQLFDLQSCHLQRNDNSDPNQFVPLLSAECSLVWITIDKTGSDTAAAPAAGA